MRIKLGTVISLLVSCGCRGYLYSSEKRVSSVLLWIHLNSRGQLPSAMQVSTTRLCSRLSWLRAGSVLKYGGTSSAKNNTGAYAAIVTGVATATARRFQLRRAARLLRASRTSGVINDATRHHCKYRTPELAGWKT